MRWHDDSVRFRDRRDAGRRLGAVVGATLTDTVDQVDLVVLALPRGGVPVAFEVAAALRAPLDVFVARKVGLPGRRELGIGAVAEGGTTIADPATLRSLGVSRADFERLAGDELAELERRVTVYRGSRDLAEVRGRDVILVDDGLATGVTAEAALGALRGLGAQRLVLAVPVAAPDTARRMRSIADDLVCLGTPREFLAVGQFYDDFGQTSDDEVLRLLERTVS